MRHPVAITIAGSDSGGGAGIQADLKTFAALGVHGTTAITALTAQNTYEVTGIVEVPPSFVVEQIMAVHRDLGIDAAKTGMLANAEIIGAVADAVEDLGFPLVVDPVMVAKSGARLLREDAVEALKGRLLPLATVATPNIPEAEVLLGSKVEDQAEAARKISERLGVPYVVLKGGHGTGSASTDILYFRGNVVRLSLPRILGGCTHGTGCSFSAAIAALMAKGRGPVEAVTLAREFIQMAIDYAPVRQGRGHCPVNPMAWLEIPAQRWEVMESLSRALEVVLSEPLFLDAVPEVGMNIAMSLDWRYARTPGDVAAVEGRIRRGLEGLVAGRIRFGASHHLASTILTAMQVHPEIRAAMNISYSEDLVERARGLGMRVSSYDRREEPPDVKAAEGLSTRWGASRALLAAGGAPDIIYHLGDLGKEAMIVILGRDAVEVVGKAIRILSGP